MSRRSRKGEEPSLAEAELNLVPYLDIMVNLIMFMLLTFQVVAELKIIQFNPPQAGGASAGAGDHQDEKLKLLVHLTKDGHWLMTGTAGAGTVHVPLKNGDYDYAKLTEELAKVQDTIPNVDENLSLAAEPDIIYDVVVKTMDAARERKDGSPLFPKVNLKWAMGTK